MKLTFRPRFTREMTIRIIADALMVNAALVIALVLRYLWLIGIEGGAASPQAALHSYTQDYLQTFWALTLFSLVLFYASGFYTHGRTYRGRYKALVIFQAVCMSYLVFGLLTLLLWDVLDFSRSALLLAWILTLVFLTGARLWSTLWRKFTKAEQQVWPSFSTEDQTRNVLVIGGAGYIGSALLPQLLDKGYHVRVLDLFIYGTEPIEPVLDHPNLELVKADFQSMSSVFQAMQGINTVIHLGAIVGDPACELDRGLTIELNSMSVRMIAEVARIMKIERFVFASTCSVYGASDEVLDERSGLSPVSLYAESKILSEKILTNMADEVFAPVILRFGTIYGFSGRTRFDLVINLLTAKAIVDGQITVFGGDQWRPFVHVEDAALAITRVLEAPLPVVSNQVFNVGSNEQNYTIQQVAEIIHRLVPTAELINMGSETDLRNYRVNFDKLRNYLEFAHRWTVEEGVQQVIDMILSGKIQDYRDPKYSNVGYLRKEGLTRFNAYSNGWIYDLLNATISPPPWDRVERRRTLEWKGEENVDILNRASEALQGERDHQKPTPDGSKPVSESHPA